ncbi:unnamed protein product [Symbiodinium sp. CCMP2456]|nr:unnamed protein product [Symbiodinium sp. CCMP2456]
MGFRTSFAISAFSSSAMASRSLGVHALVLLTAVAPAFVAQVRKVTQHPPVSRALPATKVTLFGGTVRSLERPPPKLRARGLPPWLPWLARGHQHVSIWKKLLLEHDRADFALMISLLTFILNVGNFSRAFQQTDAGEVRKAVAKMMKAFEPELAKTMVAEREVVERIETRLRSWQGHATIIAGRHGSGKSVALEEALRGRQGVYVHAVRDKDWEKTLYKDLGLDNLGMLKDALRLV